MDNFLDTLSYILIIGFAGYIIFSTIKNKGVKGAMFGAEVLEKTGEIKGTKNGLSNTRLQVHLLKGNRINENEVGIELNSRTLANWETLNISLNKDEAEKLLQMLQQTINKC